ncbi:MAG: DUF2828 family protein, partial [Clostridium sp.]|uniref:DUF2828 family protein n=1 Tax=Clostridium sp. TaxID=1506 RepID=UPI0025BCB93E
SEEEIINKYKLILLFNNDESIKFLFFIRSINKGLGERRIFRILLKYLAKENPDSVEKNLRAIPKYGRWDDLYALFDTPLENKVINLFKSQIQKDLSSNRPSNLGKWLKSENSSSKESRALGYKTRVLLNYSPKKYRKLLSTLRKKLNITESILTSKQYEKINYGDLSKIVLSKYKKAFLRNDNDKYNLYLQNEHYKEKFLPNKIINYLNSNMKLDILNKKIEKSLFDIIIKEAKILEDSIIINGLEEDENSYTLSLLLFTIVLYKKINLNAFKNHYISFKKNPKFNKLSESNSVNNIKSIYNNYSNFKIDLNAALDLLLFTLLKKNINPESAPKAILFIYNKDEDIDFKSLEINKEKWLKAGFKHPKIKLWNLNSLERNFSITSYQETIKISGYNQNIWPYLLESKPITNSKIILNKYKKINYQDIII